jgi:hypothetical protein
MADPQRLVPILLLLVSAALAQFTPASYSLNNITQPLANARAEFTLLEGKLADPCHRYTSGALPDCSSVPDASVTVLLPSESSADSATPGNLVNSINNGLTQVTLIGRNFQVFTAGTTTLALGDPVQGCANPDLFATVTGTVVPVAGGILTDTKLSLNYMTFVVPFAWISVARELEDAPRPLCFLPPAAGAYQYTGFKVGIVWACDIINGIPTCPPPSDPSYTGYQSVPFQKMQERLARKTCCKSAVGTLNVGQCIFSTSDNALAPQQCCGAAAVDITTSKCCNPAKEVISWLSSACPCSAVDSTCPTNEQCCLPAKYSELSGLKADGKTPLIVDAPGECYNPSSHQCCDTGSRYDAGVQQCCPINGLQSLNTPCPCLADSDCPSCSNCRPLRCCAQVNSTIWEPRSSCTKYANFPTGTGPYQAQRCPGTCFDPSYQICCNGIFCVQAYEKCCNNTCCNRFTQTCSPARRSGTPGNRANFNEFNVLYDSCSSMQNLAVIKIFVVLVMPIFFLMIHYFGTAICLVFANKASSRSYAAIEKSMIYVAVLILLQCWVLYFSMAWKYALFMVIVENVVILSAAVRVKALNIWTLILCVVLAIYVVDPFHGNSYLTLASSRTPEYFPARDSAGLIHTIGLMWKSDFLGPIYCSIYYLGYFYRDPALRDTDRFDNPDLKTFGFCDRAYVLTLLVFCAVMYILVLLQVLLVVLALVLRFTKAQVKLVVHEDEE